MADQTSGPPPVSIPPTAMPNGMQYIDMVVGTGAEARAGQKVHVHYTGWLVDNTKFDSSRDHARPFSFQLGGGDVIEGWDIGVVGMRIGGSRRLMIPAHLGYGPNGYPPVIPPNATLIFDVELLGMS